MLVQPGYDHAGISTQNVVESSCSKEGTSRAELGREAFVARVWEWLHEYGGKIMNQFRRMGASMDYRRDRFTMDDGYVARGHALVRPPLRARLDLSRQPDHQLVPAPRDVALRPRGRARGHGRRADDDPVPARRRLRPHHDRDGAAGDDPRRRRRRGASRRRALPRPRRQGGRRPVRRAARAGDRRRARRDGVRDGRAQGDAGARPDRLRDRPRPRSARAHRDRAGRADERRRRRARRADAGRGGEARSSSGRPSASQIEKRESYRHAVADVRALPQPHRAAHLAAVVVPRWSELASPRSRRCASGGSCPFHAGVAAPLRDLPRSRSAPDWYISRQIWWGHQMPVWYCPDGHITVAETDPDTCAECGSTELRRDEDVLDTWFSSELWPFATLGWPDETPDLARFYPGDLQTTARDIIRLWESRMIFAGLELFGEVPFTDVIIHSTMLAPRRPADVEVARHRHRPGRRDREARRRRAALRTAEDVVDAGRALQRRSRSRRGGSSRTSSGTRAGCC